MSEFTKGPWHYDGHGINAKDGERICKVQHGEPYITSSMRNERFDADSHLISACPDLLMAAINAHIVLKVMLKNYCVGENYSYEGMACLEQLEKAIAKAEGKE